MGFFKLPIKPSTVVWSSAAAAGALLLISIGLVIGLKVWIDGQQSPPSLPVGGAISAISPICVSIGRDILARNGSAADAALAMLFCENVSTPQSMGIGGGFVAVVYTRHTGEADALIARETAPAAATEDMFVGAAAADGIRAVAIPSELKGYGALHERFGRLPWSDIVQPAIDMCRNGFAVTSFLGTGLAEYSDMVRDSPAFRQDFWNEQEGRVARTGELVRRPRLGDTLEVIAREGAQSMYTQYGTIAQRLVEEMDDLGGIITMRDLEDYRVRWERPETARIQGDRTMYTTPLPASGSLLVFLLNVLDGFLPVELGWSTTFYHRLIEAFKFAYARRTFLGDAQFVDAAKQLVANLTDWQYAQEIQALVWDDYTFDDARHYGANFSSVDDHGTAHISVLAPNGDAVAVTSTINAYFGSKIMTPRTGFVLNDQMDDFSTPGITNGYGLEASPANYIAPGKMPLSSMCPTIVVDAAGNVEMVVGAAGGSKITTVVTWYIVAHLLRDKSLEETMLAPRVHHQLLPMEIAHEDGVDAAVLSGLASKGHALRLTPPSTGFGSVSAISRKNGVLTAVSDVRRNESVALI